MLNSAAGVTLPRPIAPPMVTISRTLARIAGFLTMASATLVRGPRVASVMGSVAAVERVHQEIHRMGRFRRSARLGQVGAVDPRRPVDVFGGLRLAHHGSRAAGVDRHLGPACQIPDPAGIVLGPGQRHVARDGGDAEQIEFFGRGEREQEGDGVVLARVAVDDQRSCTHGDPESYLAEGASGSASNGDSGPGSASPEYSPMSRPVRRAERARCLRSYGTRAVT